MDQFDQTFLDKLASLNGTQASIQSLSSWLIQNKSKCKHVGKLWYKELKKVHRKRKLTLLYLMNDVVQNSRKQGPEFLHVFTAVLSHAMKDCAKAADAKVMGSLDRLVRIWQDRHVFEPDQLQHCRQMLEKFAPRNTGGRHSEAGRPAATSTTAAGTNSATSTTATMAVGVAVGQDDDDDMLEEEGDSDDSEQEGPVSPALRDAGVGSDDDNDNNGIAGSGPVIAAGYGGGGGGGGVAASASALRAGLAEAREAAAAAAEAVAAEEELPDSERILAEFQFLAAAPSGSAEMRRRISRFPKHIVEEASVDACRSRRDCQRLLREVAQADEVCSAYNGQLAGEVARRRGFHADLRAYCRQQRAAMAAGQRRLEDQRRRLRELRSLQKELSSHLANLPDLASLPAVSGGLAPLPSVGDLFS